MAVGGPLGLGVGWVVLKPSRPCPVGRQLSEAKYWVIRLSWIATDMPCIPDCKIYACKPMAKGSVELEWWSATQLLRGQPASRLPAGPSCGSSACRSVLWLFH